MYGKSYWLKKGLTEEDATQRSKGNVRCYICNDFFPNKESRSTGKYICSDKCDDIKKVNAAKSCSKSKRKHVPCSVCNRPMFKKDSRLTHVKICSESCLTVHRDSLSYGTNLRESHWTNKGYSEEQAKIKVSELQRMRSPASKEYWLRKGYSEEEAVKKQSDHQKKVCSGRDHARDTKIFCHEYWEKQGHDVEDAKRIAKEKATTTNLRAFVDKYGKELGPH